MNVLVDTSVWSLALRRPSAKSNLSTAELTDLIQEGRVLMLGPIRQELLSGIRTDAHYRALKARLKAFPDLHLEQADYEDAASCFNRCRSKGVQGSSTDFLICAATLRRKIAVFTTDRDFERYRTLLSVKLHDARAS